MANFVAIALFLVVLLFLAWLFLWIRASGKVEVVGNSFEVLGFVGGKEGASKLRYWAHWKHGINGMLNTGASLQYNRTKYRCAREIIPGLDGGSFGLDWFTDAKEDEQAIRGINPDAVEAHHAARLEADNKALDPKTPIVFVVHGLAGGSSEPWVSKLGLRVRRQRGWRCCCLIMRGCCGTQLKTPQIYHGGFTEDMDVAVRHVSQRFPEAPIVMIGYSLGANALAKYLGEQTSKTTPKNPPRHYREAVKTGAPRPGLGSDRIYGAVCIGAPFNLYYVTHNYDTKQQIYAGRQLMKYAQKHKAMVEALPGLAGKVDEFEKKGDFRVTQFDETFTCKLNGYQTANDYYRDNGCWQYLDGVTTPTLFISSLNDPISLPGAIPRKEIAANPHLAALLTKGGGHLGFFGFNETRKTFDEEAALAFVEWRLEQSHQLSDARQFFFGEEGKEQKQD